MKNELKKESLELVSQITSLVTKLLKCAGNSCTKEEPKEVKAEESKKE